MTVATILSQKGRDVVTVNPDDTFKVVAELLEEKGIGAVIASTDGKKVAGILSERDLVRAIARSGASALDKPISDFMTKKVVACSDHDSIDDIMGKMTAGKFRHIPVVNGGKLDGIISIGDVVKQKIAEAEFEARAMRDYIATG